MYHRRRIYAGFTLIELLVVLAIIGILASVILSKMAVAREKALYATAQMEISQLLTTFNVLYSDTGNYPNGDPSNCRTSLPSNNEVDLSAAVAGLVANGSSWSGWKGPYVTNATDPWGNPYYFDEDYQCLADTVGCEGVTDSGNDSSVIVSCGPNGAESSGACDYDDDNVVKLICKH